MSGAIVPTRLADLARGDLAWLRAFLSGQGTDGTSRIAQLDARHDTERQDTLLTWAACHGQAEAVRLLLEVGASVGATTGGGASALHIACQQGHVQCARLLLEASAAVNQAAGGGFSPLRIASQLGHLEIAQLLRDAGADINQATQDGGTPLLIACAKGHLEIARLLLEAGAAVNQATNIGVTPLFMACQHGHLKIARLLLEAGASVNQARDDGTTPLFMACQKGHLEIVRLLLEAGAAPDQAADDGVTPLVVACYQGHLDVAKLLSSYGASRAATPFGTTVEAANSRGHADLAAWLVASRGWTPLQHLEAFPRLAAEGVSALPSRPLPLFRRRSPSTERGRCCAAARTLRPASLLPSSGRASSARGASRIRPLRPSVPESRSALWSRGRR